jgi:hypothetical protein
MPAIEVLGRLRQEDHKFKAKLGYIVRPCLKKKRGVVVNVVLCKLHLNEETGHKAK